MSLKNQRNDEAKLIYDTLMFCEMHALSHDKNEAEKKKYLISKIKTIPKSKKYARSCLKRIAQSESSTVADYLDSIIDKLHAESYFTYIKGAMDEDNQSIP